MSATDQLLLRVNNALDEIRPFLMNDGGNIRLVEITDDLIVRVELEGSCVDCSVNQMTLKSGVEMTVKKHAPEVLRIEEVRSLSKVKI
jgi:Fe-S cluster biogenesis protein NfuA